MSTVATTSTAATATTTTTLGFCLIDYFSVDVIITGATLLFTTEQLNKTSLFCKLQLSCYT